MHIYKEPAVNRLQQAGGFYLNPLTHQLVYIVVSFPRCILNAGEAVFW